MGTPESTIVDNPSTVERTDQILAQLLNQGYEFSEAELAINLTGGISLDECIVFLTQQKLGMKEQEETIAELFTNEIAKEKAASIDVDKTLTENSIMPGTTQEPIKSILKRSDLSVNATASNPNPAAWLKQNISNAIFHATMSLKEFLQTNANDSQHEEAETERIQNMFPRGRKLYDSTGALQEAVDSVSLTGSNLSLNYKKVRFSLPDVSAESETITNPHENLPHRIYTSEEILELYIHACQRRNTAPHPKILSTFEQAVSVGLPIVTIHLENETLPLPGLLALVEILGLEFGLQDLVLHNVGIGNEVLRSLLSQLWHVGTIKRVSVAYNKKIKGKGFKYLATFIRKTTSLRYLDMSGLSLLEPGALHLLGSAFSEGINGLGSTVTSLALAHCALKNEGLNIIAPFIRDSNLRTINLQSNNIDPIGAASFAKLFPAKDTDMKEYSNLNGVGLHPLQSTENAEFISADYKQGTNVREHGSGLVSVDLTANDIKHGAIFIGQTLPSCDLKKLYLTNNGIPPQAFQAIAEGLKQNKTLEVIDLSFNPLFSGETEKGIQTFTEVLSTHPNLKSVNLSHTSLTTPTLSTICNAIPLSKSLQQLLLYENPIDIVGLRALNAAVKTSDSLVEVGLDQLTKVKSTSEEVQGLVVEILSICERNAKALAEIHKAEDKISGRQELKIKINSTVTQLDSNLTLFVQILDAVESNPEPQNNDDEQEVLLTDLFRSLSNTQGDLLKFLNAGLDFGDEEEEGKLTNEILGANDKLIQQFSRFQKLFGTSPSASLSLTPTSITSLTEKNKGKSKAMDVAEIQDEKIVVPEDVDKLNEHEQLIVKRKVLEDEEGEVLRISKEGSVIEEV